MLIIMTKMKGHGDLGSIHKSVFVSLLIFKTFKNIQWPHDKLNDDEDIYCNSALFAWTKEENVIENSSLENTVFIIM